MVVGVKHGKYMYHFDLYMHDMLPLQDWFSWHAALCYFLNTIAIAISFGLICDFSM